MSDVFSDAFGQVFVAQNDFSVYQKLPEISIPPVCAAVFFVFSN